MPIIGVEIQSSVKGTRVNQPLDPTSGTGLGHIVGADHIDVKSQYWMWPEHREINRRVHPLASRQNLIVVSYIHHPILVRRTQYLGNRRARILWR